MSNQVTRSGRAKPQGSGWELAIWYLMRLTGIGLFVTALSHYIIVHFVYDPAIQDAVWVTARWASIAQRTIDWLMLTFVLFHAFMGVRTVIGDYTSGGRADLPDDAAVPHRHRPVLHGHHGRHDPPDRRQVPA